MNKNILFVSALCLASASASASAPAHIIIPGEKLLTESLTSSADGTVYVSTMHTGEIFRAAPGQGTAQLWVKAGTDGMQDLLGVLADDKSGTLWVCSADFTDTDAVPQTALHALDLKTGAPKGKWRFPGKDGYCNDIAVADDGSVYATDSGNMAVLKVAPGSKEISVWAGGDSTFGGKKDLLDGIAIVQGHVVVNVLETNKLFTVKIGDDGKAGKVTEVKLDKPIAGPDGQRSHGTSEILVVESGDGGHLSKIALSGPSLENGKVTRLKSGFPDDPTGVTVVGDVAYVVEAQWKSTDPDNKAPPKPFKATAVPLK